MSTVIFQVQSTLILALIYFGLYHKRNRTLHVNTMLSAIVWDVLLILQIELSRKAIATALKPLENKLILNFHITIAVLTVITYIAIIFTGRKLLQGEHEIRPKHKMLGMTAVTLRTITYITSYFVV